MNSAPEQPEENKTSSSKHEIKPGLNILLMGAGSIFTSMLLAGFIVGYMLDQIFDTMPIFLMLCGVLGFIGGIQKVHLISSKMDQNYANKAKARTDEKKRTNDA